MPGIFLSGNFVKGITLILLFAFVLAVTYFTTRFIANYQKKTNVRGNIEIIEIRRISATKSIEIVRIGSDYFALAIGKDEINLIGKLDESSIKLPDEYAKGKTTFFSDVISSLLKKDGKEDGKGKL